jgi:tetratricopeptide (TPR) repeat protein
VFWVSSAVVVCGLIALLLFFPSSDIPFQERDWIVITDFDNQTGDNVFDKSLNTALRVNIQQSRYVNVFPASRVKETMQRMGKEAQDVLTEEVAGEVAQREGIKAVLSCKIDQVGEVYSLTASIIDPMTQMAHKTENAQARGKDQVLDALDDLVGQIRKDLGESLKEIKDQRVMLPRATTSSLEALKLFAEGEEAWGKRHDDEAIVMLKNALELDPEFAMAHAQLGSIYYWGGNRVDGEKHFTAALELIDRLTERESLLIQSWIPAYRGNRDEATIKYKVYLRKYPDDPRGWHNLAHNYLMLKRYDESIEAFNRHLELYPTSASAFINLATCYTSSGRYELAIEHYKKGFDLNPQFLKVKNLNSEYGFTLVAMGDIEQAEEAFRLLLEGDESLQAAGHRHMALLYMYQGMFSQAEQQLNEAIRLNNTRGNTLSEYRDRLFLVTAYRNQGMQGKAVQELAKALEIRRSANIGPWWLQLAAKIYARMGMTAEAEAVFEEISSQINEENRSDRAIVNILQGEFAIARGKPAEAVEFLERAYLLREDNYVLESLANAYYQMKDLDKAVEKYQGIVDHIDLGWEAQACWVLAHYHLGKIYTEQDEIEEALNHLERFVALWKDGDQDLPALKEARVMIKALQQ